MFRADDDFATSLQSKHRLGKIIKLLAESDKLHLYKRGLLFFHPKKRSEDV